VQDRVNPETAASATAGHGPCSAVVNITSVDLIVFPDGRVWYVRDVQGGNMEVVGWIGDNAKSEDINSFVLLDHDFTIVRKNDPKWADDRGKYFKQ
jgi:hypothetical protein